jgi:hypothetical protein
VRQLVSHGANLEYADHALRNALYWSVYHGNGEITMFLLESGARVRPWTWLEMEALPAAILDNHCCTNYIRMASAVPTRLVILARTAVREWLTLEASGRSIHPLINSLGIASDVKQSLKLQEKSPRCSKTKSSTI